MSRDLFIFSYADGYCPGNGVQDGRWQLPSFSMPRALLTCVQPAPPSPSVSTVLLSDHGQALCGPPKGAVPVIPSWQRSWPKTHVPMCMRSRRQCSAPSTIYEEDEECAGTSPEQECQQVFRAAVLPPQSQICGSVAASLMQALVQPLWSPGQVGVGQAQVVHDLMPGCSSTTCAVGHQQVWPTTRPRRAATRSQSSASLALGRSIDDMKLLSHDAGHGSCLDYRVGIGGGASVADDDGDDGDDSASDDSRNYHDEEHRHDDSRFPCVCDIAASSVDDGLNDNNSANGGDGLGLGGDLCS